MAHSLRKYLSNRGSALFMVVSTMTALMIACMAMYFSVVSSRSTQFATFFREQSYQSALSLNDMVLAGLMDGSLTSGTNDLFSKLQAMEEGDTITTGANGFSSFDSSLTGADTAQMGAYTMDITRLPNEMINGRDNMTFDIATTTVNNGVMDTVHSYIHVDISGGELPDDNNIFAATGYVDNDASLGGGFFITDVFFDTETSYISMPGGAGACYISGNLRAGGSLTVYENFQIMGPGVSYGSADFSIFDDPVSWQINGNLTCAMGGGVLKFPKGTKIVIGGDYVFKGGGMEGIDGPIDVYVCGDLIIDNSLTYQATNTNLHIGGDITGGQINNASAIYVNGSDNRLYTHTNDGTPDMGEFAEIKTKLKEATQSRAYAKWVINDGDPDKGLDKTKSDYLPELDPTTVSLDPTHRRYTPITIKLNDYNVPVNGVDAMTTIYTIAYPGSPSESEADVICMAGDIKSVEGGFGGNMAPLTIVIDTGDNVDNIMTLRVNGYMDEAGNDGGNIFQWFRRSCTACLVLVKGKGSLVIDIPEGTTYQDCDRQLFMHHSWYSLLTETDGTTQSWTGSVQNDTGTWQSKTAQYYDSMAFHNLGEKTATTAAKYIHTNCTHGDGCTYTKYTSTEQCKNHEDETVYKIGVKCDVHGRTSVSEVCPECHPDKAEEIDDLVNGTYETGVCQYRLEKDKMDADGLVFPRNIYPNVNIYLVSCSESADIRVGNSLSGAAIHHNGFYGFIYAPYMSFKAKGNSGGSNKVCGGLIVSDFAFDDTRFITNVYPDKMPWELMGESSGDELVGLADKSWKIGLGSY